MSIQQLQQQVDEWIKQYGVRYFSELTNMAILTEEVGVVARVMSRKYGEQSYKESDDTDLGEELADVLFVVLCIANQTNIDLQASFEKKLEFKTQRDSLRHKNKNIAFPYLEKELELNDIQNYTPIYDVFFTLNDSNRNNINLNNKLEIVSITKKVADKIYECFVEDIKGNKKKVNIFFKFAPLLDPLKYLIGKYENNDITSLPNNNKECNKKMLDVNNSAYVDNFFSYLTSKLLHEYGFIHGLDYHGGFLAIKNNYVFNCEDDIDYIINYSFFNRNKDDLFTLTEEFKELMLVLTV